MLSPTPFPITGNHTASFGALRCLSDETPRNHPNRRYDLRSMRKEACSNPKGGSNVRERETVDGHRKHPGSHLS